MSSLNPATLQDQCRAASFLWTYSMIDIDDLATYSSCRAREYALTSEEAANLRLLANSIDENLFKSFLLKEGFLKILLFDVETNESDRDRVKLVGVLAYPDCKIFHFDQRLTRADLEWLVGPADLVVFAAFNYGFDLVRAFDAEAKKILLRRRTSFGGNMINYYILRMEGKISYAIDIMRLCNNLLSDKKHSLAKLSEENTYFKKLATDDYLDLRYNTYDLLSEFELLSRAQKKAKQMLERIEFKETEIVDFISKQSRYETIESHMSRIKLFESGSRLAKSLVAPYAKYPSLPAFFAGGRVTAYRVGNVGSDWAYYDINSEYPSIISRMSPRTMGLCYGQDAVRIAEGIIKDLMRSGHAEVFRKHYVDQESQALLLSSWILVKAEENVTLRVESLREKSKKESKLSEYSLVYRNKRQEQTRAEGYAFFKKGTIFNIPLYFLFLQSPESLRHLKIIDAVGFSISRDERWQRRWELLYQLRAESPELKTALKVALNASYGLSVDVDQPFANMMIGSHVPAFSRTLSYIVERELGDDIYYCDTDGFMCSSASAHKLEELLKMLSPFGAKREYPDGEQLIIFRTKRYAIRTGDDWVAKGGEKLGGREKNKIMSYLRGTDREAVGDIRQVTKRSKTPNIPAVRNLLKDSETGEWCYYFAYPIKRLDRSLILDENEVFYEETTSGEVNGYFACKRRKPLEQIASRLPPLPPAMMSFVKTDTMNIIPAEVFTPLLGNIDTTFLEGQVSLASLLNLPLNTREKMKIMSKTISALGNSNNRGVKLGVETLETESGTVIEVEPHLKALPRRARKKSPFSQRRFFVTQRYPYKINYHIGQDSLDGSQYRKRKLVFRHAPVWTLGHMAKVIDTFLKDLKLLEDRFNQVLSEEISKSENIILSGFFEDLRMKLVPYARYTRFDVSLDISVEDVAGYIGTLEKICEEDGTEYHKGLGYLGIRGRDISDSKRFVPANIVIYNRNIRFEKHLPSFLRKYKPFVEGCKNEDVGRVEIQTFAHRSNNRKANPMASMLNALEMLKLQAPRIFDFLIDILSVITHMLPDPAFGSGAAGQNSPASTSPDAENSRITPMLGGFMPEHQPHSSMTPGPKKQRKKRYKQ